MRLDQIKKWAKALMRDVHALGLAARDPRVPWPAKLIAFFVLAYALSPIDLIPDFIPILGYLDELVVLPAGIWLATALIPEAIFEEHRKTASAQQQANAGRKKSWVGAGLVIGTWITAAAVIIWLIVG